MELTQLQRDVLTKEDKNDIMRRFDKLEALIIDLERKKKPI